MIQEYNLSTPYDVSTRVMQVIVKDVVRSGCSSSGKLNIHDLEFSQ